MPPKMGLLCLATALAVAGVFLARESAAGGATDEPAQDAAGLFLENCSVCHGKAGNLRKERDFTNPDIQRSLSDAQMADSIKNGRGQMPSFKNTFSDEQIAALVRRIRQFAKANDRR